MANFKDVNKAIKAAFPDLDVQAVRGEGYVYFDGADGFDKVKSLWSNPVTTPTDIMIHLCKEEIQEAVKPAPLPELHMPEGFAYVPKSAPVRFNKSLQGDFIRLFEVLHQERLDFKRQFECDFAREHLLTSDVVTATLVSPDGLGRINGQFSVSIDDLLKDQRDILKGRVAPPRIVVTGGFDDMVRKMGISVVSVEDAMRGLDEARKGMRLGIVVMDGVSELENVMRKHISALDDCITPRAHSTGQMKPVLVHPGKGKGDRKARSRELRKQWRK